MIFIELIEDQWGEYVVLSKNAYPSMVYFIKDKKIVHRKEMNDSIDIETKKILGMLRLPICSKGENIFNHPQQIEEVVIGEFGVWKYTLNVKEIINEQINMWKPKKVIFKNKEE